MKENEIVAGLKDRQSAYLTFDLAMKVGINPLVMCILSLLLSVVTQKIQRTHGCLVCTACKLLLYHKSSNTYLYLLGFGLAGGTSLVPKRT